MDVTNISLRIDSRPYRSHKVPACDSCRRKKIRCEIDKPGLGCRLCRKRKTPCKISQTKHQAKGGSLPKLQARRHSQVVDVSCTNAASSPDIDPIRREQFTSSEECSTVIANPTMAEDIEILEAYVTSQAVVDLPRTKYCSRVSKSSSEPILYLPVPQRRIRLSDPRPLAGREQRDIMDQVLGPMKEELIQLYFTVVHPCLPIVDRDTFWDLWSRDRDRISPTLICDIYALALPYWATSETLKWRPRPDSAFAWNQAVAALQKDFTSPSVTTVHAALLDLSGRPALEMRDNLLNVGRTVSLAHSLGLHRNPALWRIQEAEKVLRIKLWWAVVVHDYWSSLTHGTPPNIHMQNFDVPLPASELLPSADDRTAHATSSTNFVSLCSLTKVLGDILPLIYVLRPEPADMWKNIRRLECSLDELEVLPDFQWDHAGHAGAGDSNGRCNLRLCLLTLRLVLSRVALRAASLDDSSVHEIKDYRLAMLRESALSVVKFVVSMEDRHFREYWLPYASHILVMVTTVLLRCIADGTFRIRRECAQSLSDMLDRLEMARNRSEWELADMCLDRYQGVLKAIVDSLSPPSGVQNCSSSGRADRDGCMESTLLASGDLSDPASSADFNPLVDHFGYPWESFWDNFDEAWWPFE